MPMTQRRANIAAAATGGTQGPGEAQWSRPRSRKHSLDADDDAHRAGGLHEQRASPRRTPTRPTAGAADGQSREEAARADRQAPQCDRGRRHRTAGRVPRLGVVEGLLGQDARGPWHLAVGVGLIDRVGLHAVDARAAFDHPLDAIDGAERVVAAVAEEAVPATVALQLIVPRVADEHVVTLAAHEHVVALAAADAIGAGPALQDVGPFRPGQGQRQCADRSGDRRPVAPGSHVDARGAERGAVGRAAGHRRALDRAAAPDGRDDSGARLDERQGAVPGGAGPGRIGQL